MVGWFSTPTAFSLTGEADVVGTGMLVMLTACWLQPRRNG